MMKYTSRDYILSTSSRKILDIGQVKHSIPLIVFCVYAANI